MRILTPESSKVCVSANQPSTFWMLKTAGLRGTKDPVLLELAARQGRILISHDRETMTQHFCERLAAGKPAPGLFIVPQQPSAIGEVVESLLLVWTASQAEEWRNQITYLPFR